MNPPPSCANPAPLCLMNTRDYSYLDVVNRLDAVVVALEREDGPVMIVSHQV